MRKEFFVVAATIISSSLLAQQQDSSKTKQLDEVVVTATKTALKQSQTGKVVSVINQETLKQNQGKTLTEILNLQAGMFVNGANNTLGTNQDNYLRGAASGNTLILIDGIPAGDPSQINNSFDLNNVNPDQVERIEILKGAQSTLWGSDAVAGVINIITKKGGNKPVSPAIGFSYGSYKTFKANAGLNGKIKGFSYNLNYTHTGTKGFSSATDSTGNKGYDNDGFNQNNFQGNIGYDFTPAFSARVMSSYGKYKTDLDAGAFTDDKDYTGTNTSFINTLALVYKVKQSAIHFTTTLIDAKRLLADDSGSIGGFSKYQRGNYKGKSRVSELYGNFQLTGKLSLVAGLQYIRQTTDQSYFSISSFGLYSPPALSSDSAKTTNVSAYASLNLLDAGGFNIEAGVRYNHHNIYGSNATYSFNPSYTIDDNTRVFINISSAYKIPSLYQLYDFDAGNKNLQPEESNNYELGIQTLSNNKRNSFRLVAFKRDIRNLIVYYTSPSFDNQYINRDKQNDYGFEIESNTAIGKIGNWINNFTYVDGEGKNNNVKVKNLYRRPNFVANSILTVQPLAGLTLSPSFRFVGTRIKGQYDAGPATMPQYYTVGFYAGYDIVKQVRLFADLKNLTNQEYFDIPGYNSRKFNFTVGVNANF
jgi:vitamin B12 transporter